jgi:hypothetical protein
MQHTCGSALARRKRTRLCICGVVYSKEQEAPASCASGRCSTNLVLHMCLTAKLLHTALKPCNPSGERVPSVVVGKMTHASASKPFLALCTQSPGA